MRAQKTLKAEDEVVVYADNREMRSSIVKRLYDSDVKIVPQQLHVADFQVSERVGIERKSVPDFLQSLVDGRLFEQAGKMKETFERPILLLVGGENLFSSRNLHENAIRGALLSLAVDYRMPIIWAEDEEDAAKYIRLVARREQLDLKKSVQIRGKRRDKSVPEWQEFLVAGLPNVGSTLARKMLKKFKTPEKVFAAEANELEKVEKVGPQKAKRIREVLTKRYG